MNPQLQAVIDDLSAASDRLEALTEWFPDALWSVRPRPDSWSASECVAHLNLTSVAFIPPLRASIDDARELRRGPPERYRRDPVGWLIWRMQDPSSRLRSKTASAFVPPATGAPDELRTEFARLQTELLDCVREADGLPLQAVRIVSPFDPRARYNVYSALTIVARHEHRHLLQAERAAQAVSPLGV